MNMNERLEWNEFKDKFHGSWHDKISPFIESEACYNIYQTLKNSKERIFPDSTLTWRAFERCDYRHLKAIFVGQCPYHTIAGNTPVADGLAFSCGITNKLSPSLTVLYDAMDDDLKCKVTRHPDLEFWSMQNILLINTSLTVKALKADSHQDLWDPWVKYMFTEVLNTVTGVPIVLFGDVAKQKVEKHLFPMSQPYKCVKHPAYYARTNSAMEHDGLFSWVSKINKENNNELVYWDYEEWLLRGLPF